MKGSGKLNTPVRAGVFDAGPQLLTALREEADRSRVDVAWVDLAPLDRADHAEALADLDFAFTREFAIDREMLGAMRKCQLVGVLGEFQAGVSPSIELEFARHAGIYVGALPGLDAEWAAQWALGQIKAGLREWQRLRQRRKPKIGFLGLGATGYHLARMCAELKADLLACDPFTGPERFEKYDIQSVQLDSLIVHSDIISIQLPLHRATHRLLSIELLRGLKAGSMLICISDSRVIELECLQELIETGRLSRCFFSGNIAAHLPVGHPLTEHQAIQANAMAAPDSGEFTQTMARAINAWVDSMIHGQRPAHLLIDPPCPRHILALAGQD